MKEKLQNLPPFLQVLALFIIGIVSYIFISIIITLTVQLFYSDLPITDTGLLMEEYPVIFMLVYYFPFQFGVLLIPGFIYWKFLKPKGNKFNLNIKNIAWSVLIFSSVVLLLPLFSELNNIITKFFGAYDALEAQKISSDETLTMLISSSDLAFFVGVLIIGIITGIAEEFAFRGFIQNHIFDNTKRLDFAILGSALIFALLHFNYFQFIPLLIFGIVLAMIYFITKSLIPGIILHALNNILNLYWLKNDSFPSFLEEMSLKITIPSALLLMGLIYIKKNNFNLSDR